METNDEKIIAIAEFLSAFIKMKLLSSITITNRDEKVLLELTDPSVNDGARKNDDDDRDDNFGSDYDADELEDEDSEVENMRGNAEAEVEDEEADTALYSNVALSGMSTFQNMEQLQLGTPQYICAQFHNALVVQTTNKECTLTLIGNRTCGHTIGGLLTLLPQITNCPYFVQMSEVINND